MLTIDGSKNTVEESKSSLWVFEINMHRAETKYLDIYLTTGRAAKYTNSIPEKIYIGLSERYCKCSPPEVFCKKGVLKNFAKFTGKHLCQSLIFNEVGKTSQV